MFENFPLIVALFSGGVPNPSVFPASLLISDEPNAFAIDFLSNTYAMNISTGAESLIYNDQVGFAIDMTDNSYAVKY